MSVDRAVIVTGAASGVGAAVCRMMAGPGIGVVVHTRRNREGAEATAAAVRAAGGVADIVLGDLAEPRVGRDVVACAVETFGRLDVLVHNAGFADRTPVSGLTDQAVVVSQEAIAGAFLRMARAGMPHLRESGQGRVIAVSSFVAHAFRPDLTVFAASAAAKAALEAWVRALAVEMGPAGVTVNAVAPGFIRKDAGAHLAMEPGALAAQVARVPLGRVGLPEDVAAVIAFLASAAAGYVTGQVVHVNGGLVI